MSGLPKVYCWINSGAGTDWVVTVGMAEDGHGLAGHCSSSDGWAKHDIIEFKRDAYAKHYPDGYEIVWIEGREAILNHEGLNAAMELNRALADAAERDSEPESETEAPACVNTRGVTTEEKALNGNS